MKAKSTKSAPSSNWKKLLPSIKATQTTTTSSTTLGKRKGESTKVLKTKKTKRTHDSDIKEKTKKNDNGVKITPDNKVIPKKDDLWFEVDEKDLEVAYGRKLTKTEEETEERERKKLILDQMDAVKGKDAKIGKYVAIDCEMVGVGPEGKESALARVSLVNYNGAVLLDIFVKPQEKVTDYRTAVSGITPELLKNGCTFKEAQQQVADIIKDRVLIGHAVYNDMKVLMLRHPKLLIRDTSRYKPFRELVNGRTPGLKNLVNKILKVQIQSGSHSSVEDARFTMSLYKHAKSDWEKSFGAKHGLEMKKFMQKHTKKNNNNNNKKVSWVKDQSSLMDSDDDDSEV
ncbi:ribonuclease H-like domain-containing protein [Halteromyces radiatus]|uniref:ribonuclease H-like domain-containing protein n=1 Tax=Halteromyces radiatus TaxID=101107 RepID=UPI0022208371|nr:ribonuclease H-like domain-containing protein [Halteromyces radiatus]KAI8084661.1 ribonuclease H-like domain-containing protein [Halteromyces radiatus]